MVDEEVMVNEEVMVDEEIMVEQAWFAVVSFPGLPIIQFLTTSSM